MATNETNQTDTDKRCSAHPEARISLILTPDIKHYGKYVCEDCGKFIVWSKSPTTSYALEDRKREIVRLLMQFKFNERDTAMLCKLYSMVHLTDLQNESWLRLQRSGARI
jgi:hypothetical protein